MNSIPLQRIINNALAFGSMKEIAESVFTENIECFELKDVIENGLYFQSTKALARNLYIENFSNLSIMDRISLANKLEENLLSVEFFENNNINKKDYFETVLFCVQHLQPSKRAVRVLINSEPFGMIRIRYNKFCNQWLKLIKECNDSKVSIAIMDSFKELLEKRQDGTIVEAIKQFKASENEFNNYYQDYQIKDLEKSILAYYMNTIPNKLERNSKIGLLFEDVMKSEKFQYFISNHSIEIPYQLVDLNILAKTPVEIKRNIKIKIKEGDLEALEQIKKDGFVGYQYGEDQTKIFLEFKEKIKRGNFNFEKMLNTFEPESKMFFLEHFDLKRLQYDLNFKKEVFELLRSMNSKLTEDEKALLIINYKL